MRISHLTSLLAGAGLAVLLAGPAAGFSQIGREDGTAPDRDGVISTPLPPLDAQAAPSVPPAPAKPDPAIAPPSDPPPAANEPAPPIPPASAPPSEAPAAGQPEGEAAPADRGASSTSGEEEGTNPAVSQQALPEEPTGPPPDIHYGDTDLPAPVRDLRAKLMEIAKSGEIEKLRPLIEPGEDGTVLSFGGVEGDVIDYLKTASGDGEGVETLAILLEVLEAGHIKSEAGTENEIYVWPYFSGLAIDKLTKQQKVELFELVTAGDYQEMVAFGAYNFYRVGISPDGKLQFFVAGD